MSEDYFKNRTIHVYLKNHHHYHIYLKKLQKFLLKEKNLT